MIQFAESGGTVSLLDHHEITHLTGVQAGGGLPIANTGMRFGMSCALIGTHGSKRYVAVGTQLPGPGMTLDGSEFVLAMSYVDNGTAHDDLTVESYSHFTYSDIAGLEASDIFGYASAGIGDLDANGFPDLAVSALKDDDGVMNAGAAYLLFLDEGVGSQSVQITATQKISLLEGSFSTNCPISSQFAQQDGFGASLGFSCRPNYGPILLVGTRFFGASNEGLGQLLFLEQDIDAQSTSYNGSIPNPEFLSQTAPAIVGQNWELEVDTQGFGYNGDWLYVGLSASSGGMLNQWEILIGDVVIGPSQSTTGQHLIPLSSDPCLLGVDLYAQSAVFVPGNGIVMTNGIHAVIGNQ